VTLVALVPPGVCGRVESDGVVDGDEPHAPTNSASPIPIDTPTFFTMRLPLPAARPLVVNGTRCADHPSIWLRPMSEVPRSCHARAAAGGSDCAPDWKLGTLPPLAFRRLPGKNSAIGVLWLLVSSSRPRPASEGPPQVSGKPGYAGRNATFLTVSDHSVGDKPSAVRYSGITSPEVSSMSMNQCCQGIASSSKMSTMSV